MMDAALSFASAAVLEHRRLARDTFLIRLSCPAIARAIRPGQFVMLRLPQALDPLLGRPFALYDTVLNDAGEPAAIDIVYLVVGKMTSLLPRMKVGESLDIWGPLGNGFPPPKTSGHVALVAGGIGQTPFLAHIRELLGTRGYGGQAPRHFAKRVSLYYGVRTADLAAGVDDFRAAGAEVHLASNDGSIGHCGFVTDLLSPLPRYSGGEGPGVRGLNPAEPLRSREGRRGAPPPPPEYRGERGKTPPSTFSAAARNRCCTLWQS
jgi:dihydroorotate dehydrogenase electron transfer subunit